MNAEYFEEQRREMVAAIRAMADHLAAEIGKSALDERVLRPAGCTASKSSTSSRNGLSGG
jgi:hypothetical protein